MNLKIKLLNSEAKLPAYQTEHSAGMDVCACIDGPVVIRPGERQLIGCGFSVAIPEGYELQIRPRSGNALKYGITMANAVGTIDADYRGEIGVILLNLGQEDFVVNSGDRIAQMVLAKYEKAELETVDSLDETLRGEGGFGHTGK